MSLYHYIARTASGEEKRGTREAKDEYELASFLRQENTFLISSNLDAKSSKNINLDEYIAKILHFFKLNRKIPVAERMIFSRNLSVMIGAGLALARALEVLAQQTTNLNFRATLKSVISEIQKGKAFSDALSIHPDSFSDLYINMVRSAEVAGNLEDVLKLLTKQLQKEYDLKRKIKGAFTYPIVILTVMTGIGILMITIVVPSLSKTFAELGVPLPLPTRIIIGISNFAINYWYLALAMITGLIYSLSVFFRTTVGQNVIDVALMKTPLVGPLNKQINSARFSRTLSSLLEGGVPIIKSLEIVSKAIPNHLYHESLTMAINEVQKGRSLSEILSRYPELYPPLVTQMISVGEETGAVSSILKHLAVFFEAEVSQATKNMSTIIEPFLMVIIGIAVGLFAISMLQPMYSLVDVIK